MNTLLPQGLMEIVTMPSSDVRQQLRSFIMQNFLLGREHSFDDSDSFLDHGLIDSTGVLELVEFLQETYGITIEDEELVPQNLDSINAISSYLAKKLNGTSKVRAIRREANFVGEPA